LQWIKQVSDSRQPTDGVADTEWNKCSELAVALSTVEDYRPQDSEGKRNTPSSRGPNDSDG